MSDTSNNPLDSEQFRFWHSPAGMTLAIGDGVELTLPAIPFPLIAKDFPADSSATPSERLIGEGMYEYLCSCPDCEHAAEYVAILRRAYPFLISDLGAQLLVLDIKNTEAAALKRKIALLKIMLYLDPGNFGLLHKLGVACFHLAVNRDELRHVRRHLLDARRWLEQARRIRPEDISNLSYVGQVCYLGGNYHQAQLYWQTALKQAGPQDQLDLLKMRVDNLAQGIVPEQPLQQLLEQTGLARAHYANHEFEAAHALIESVLRQGDLARELPSVEFYYFLGLCREKTGDCAGAYEALMMATALDDKHEPARQALARVAP